MAQRRTGGGAACSARRAACSARACLGPAAGEGGKQEAVTAHSRKEGGGAGGVR